MPLVDTIVEAGPAELVVLDDVLVLDEVLVTDVVLVLVEVLVVVDEILLVLLLEAVHVPKLDWHPTPQYEEVEPLRSSG
jgi:hypothetical protein